MDSDEYSTDESNKKRPAAEQIETGFKKSKKTPRSPAKQEENGESSKLDLIVKMISEIKNEQMEIKEEVVKVRKEQQEYKEEMRRLKQENEMLKSDNAKIKKENEDIKKELQEISLTMEGIEKQRRKNNIVITGLQLQTNDSGILRDTINSFLRTELKIDATAKHVTKVGEKTSVVEMHTEEDKKIVMQNKSKLKEWKVARVYINDDLTKKEQLKQKQIRITAAEQRKEGKTVKIGYNKLTIDGTDWRWDRTTGRLQKSLPKN